MRIYADHIPLLALPLLRHALLDRLDEGRGWHLGLLLLNEGTRRESSVGVARLNWHYDFLPLLRAPPSSQSIRVRVIVLRILTI